MRQPPRSTQGRASAAADVYKRQACGSSSTGGGSSSGGGGGKTLVISSDLPLQSASKDASDSTNQIIELYREQIGSKAGDYTIEFKKYDDSTAAAGKWDQAQCTKNAQDHVANANEVAVMGTYNSGCAKIIVPVLPSDIDIHAASRCIADLLLVAKVRRGDNRIGVIANRVRRNTLTYQALMRFLETLGIPIVATFRDSQSYVRSAELGIGIHEMKRHQVAEDVAQWEPLIAWIESAAPGAHGSSSGSQDGLPGTEPAGVDPLQGAGGPG